MWFVLSTAIPSAFASESDNVGLGAGVATCRQFAEFRKLEYGPTMLHFTAWAHGFMSAMNLNTYESVGTFRELSPDVSFQQSFYLDFCDKFPDRLFVTAVQTLYETFPVRMKR